VDVPVEFVLFGLTLIGVAVFHRQTLAVALLGLTAITIYKVVFSDFYGQPGLSGLWFHLIEEWVILANLFALLVGFALLSRHFEESHVPRLMPRVLPDDWKGGFTLLAMVFVLSAFLDNIAAAIIGATVAGAVYRNKLHIGFLAAIVAASNAGGAGSVIGDTTTTMMWLQGVSPLEGPARLRGFGRRVFRVRDSAARAQQRFSPIEKNADSRIHVDWARVIIVVLILIAAIAANIHANNLPPGQADAFPYIGATVIGVLLLVTPWRRPGLESGAAGRERQCIPARVGAVGVDDAGREAAALRAQRLRLGFVSAVFDNIR
jgi:hypothetical protein